jgi:hypothetical protein
MRVNSVVAVALSALAIQAIATIATSATSAPSETSSTSAPSAQRAPSAASAPRWVSAPSTSVPSTTSSTSPATTASESVEQLIQRMGDDDFSVREDAMARLRKMGPGILPQLNTAMANPDAEIRTRVWDLIHDLSTEEETVVQLPDGMQVTVRRDGDKKTTLIFEKDRHVTIVQQGSAITVQIVRVQARLAMRQVTASSLMELNKDAEAAALYEKYGHVGDKPAAAAVAPAPVAPAPVAPVPIINEINLLQARLARTNAMLGRVENEIAAAQAEVARLAWLGRPDVLARWRAKVKDLQAERDHLAAQIQQLQAMLQERLSR